MVSAKTFSITKYVMSNDIDDIQDPRYNMRRRTFFNLLIMYYVRGFAWAWMALRARNAFPSGGHFEPPEHVPRPLARGQTGVRGPGGLPACHRAESTRKDPRPEEKKMPKGQKNTFIYVYEYTRLAILLHINCRMANMRIRQY